MFNLGSVGALAGGFMDQLSQNDIDALNKLKLQNEQATAEGQKILGSMDLGALSQLFQPPSMSSPMAPPPGQPSQPAPQPPMQVASAAPGGGSNLTGPDRITLTGDGRQDADVQDALLKRALAAGQGQPIGGTQLGPTGDPRGLKMAGGFGQQPPPQLPQLPQVPQQPPQTPQPQQRPQPQGDGGMQGMGGVDLGRLVDLIKKNNPKATPQGIWSAVTQAYKVLNPESKMMLQYMMNERRLEEQRRYHNMQSPFGEGGERGEDALSRLGWTQKAINDAARVFIDTGEMPKNLGTRQVATAVSGAVRRAANQQMTDMGLTAADLPKRWAQYMGERQYQRSAGSFASRVEAAVNEVEQLLPQAIETSTALPRGQFVPFNSLYQKWLEGTSDPAYNDFMFATFSLRNAYLRAMNPTGQPRIAERLETEKLKLLDTATSPEAFMTQARRLWKEVQASKKAIAETQKGRTEGNVNAPMPGDTRGGGGGAQDRPDPLGIR